MPLYPRHTRTPTSERAQQVRTLHTGQMSTGMWSPPIRSRVPIDHRIRDGDGTRGGVTTGGAAGRSGREALRHATLSKRSNRLTDVWSRDDTDASLLHGCPVDAGAGYGVPFEVLGGVLATPPVAVSWAGE